MDRRNLGLISDEADRLHGAAMRAAAATGCPEAVELFALVGRCNTFEELEQALDELG